ncbi:MAG: hypothetical protein LQ340_003904 [Diploschistes diacapsis]|nr:MAG: hypothetical protein LQ340_003904 [Diploschistes diacapsis]
MASSTEHAAPELPFQISCISSTAEKYILFDVDVITWLRCEHHILGVLIGTLPQIPQQNVFLGLPLELMPEEARLLVESGLAYIVHDQEWHHEGLQNFGKDRLQGFQRELTSKGMEAAKTSQSKKAENTERVLKRLELDRCTTPSVQDADNANGVSDPSNGAESLFGSIEHPQAHAGPSVAGADTNSWGITPTTSYPPLTAPLVRSELSLPDVSIASYALFKHLHKKGYFISPGLRFGCQYTAYPGDPLRYHSHFLAVGLDWNEKIDLLDIIGGGRLGTGVKKSYLLGGPEGSEGREEENHVRTFCIEWAGM